MLADMTAPQFEDWWTLHLADPWGDTRADWRSAREVWATFQAFSKRKLRERDYLMKFRRAPGAINPATYKQMAAARYARFNAAKDAIARQRGGRKAG